MNVLGIETSSLTGSIAIRMNGRLAKEHFLEAGGRRHAQTLLAEIQALLKEFDLTPKNIGLICVSTGPGSFTGLRVGVVCAKTWSFATNCPLIGVSTFAAIACTAPDAVSRLWVVDDAQRDEVFAEKWERSNEGQLMVVEAGRLFSVANFVNRLSSEDSVAGPGEKKLIAHRVSARYLPLKATAQNVAALGEEAFLAQKRDSEWSLLPKYARKSAAEEKWELTQQGR